MTISSDPFRETLTRHLDVWWTQYRERLDDLTDAEHLWSPVEGWTVRESDGVWRVDPVDREADPAPFTSIAWRMWHIAVDCLDSYSLRAFGLGGTGLPEDEWVGTATEAIAMSEAAWTNFRDGIGGLDQAGLEQPLGPLFGGFADRSHAALALHAQAELTHHGAEVGVLRDLYRSSFSPRDL